VEVLQFLYIKIDAKVIGTNVAVNMIPHIFTMTTGTLYAAAIGPVAGER